MMCEPVGQVVARGAQGSQRAPKYAGVLQALRLVVREEGVRSLWKGNLTAELLWGAYMASQFFIYRACQVGVLPRYGPRVCSRTGTVAAHTKNDRPGSCPGAHSCACSRCTCAQTAAAIVCAARPREQRTCSKRRSGVCRAGGCPFDACAGRLAVWRHRGRCGHR